MASRPSGPAFVVHVDDLTLTDDLARANKAGRAAIELMIQRLKADGAPAAWLKRCDAEARDGTRLPGCVKLYIPQPIGRWGAVFLGGAVDRSLTLFLLAVGERHPERPGGQASTRSPTGGSTDTVLRLASTQ